MRIFLFFLLLMLATPCFLRAQIPGYMGKKLSVCYNFGFSPALIGPNAKGRTMSESKAYQLGLERKFFSFNGTHSLSADYVVGRRRTLGLGISSYKTQVVFSRFVIVEDASKYSNYYAPGESRAYTPSIDNYSGIRASGDIKSLNITVFTRKFGRKYIAPFGKYTKWEAFALIHRTVYDTLPFLYGGNDEGLYNYNTEAIGSGDNRNTSFGFAFEFGKQRIFAHTILMNYSIRAGYVFGTIKRASTSGAGAFEPASEENYIKTMSTLRLFRRELFTAKIGFGLVK